jgi:hypothetical protein
MAALFATRQRVSSGRYLVSLRLRATTLLILCTLLAPAVALAQASIAGVVTDASGAVLPGVTVEATSPVLIENARTAVSDGVELDGMVVRVSADGTQASIVSTPANQYQFQANDVKWRAITRVSNTRPVVRRPPAPGGQRRGVVCVRVHGREHERHRAVDDVPDDGKRPAMAATVRSLERNR